MYTFVPSFTAGHVGAPEFEQSSTSSVAVITQNSAQAAKSARVDGYPHKWLAWAELCATMTTVWQVPQLAGWFKAT